MSNRLNVAPNDLSAYWMPFTANRQFKQAPRLFVRAKDMHYETVDGRQVLDATAGLWCCNAGHGRPKIVEAISAQVAEMDYSPAFQMGHPKIFELANRLVDIAPQGMNHAFFTNSGSESVETALKMAIAYHRTKGEGSRFRLIGRERGYHGVNFGGISVGGMVANRKMFGTLLTGVDHLPHTYLKEHAFTRGIPERGDYLADELERLIALHDTSTIAAVIVEPVAGSTGVIMPPKGYLEKLRAITKKHGILLIFDEVITGFGRLGTPFATDYFGVTPDLITCAKGLTNGVIPMGAVLATSEIHDTFMNAAAENAIEFLHGYTYSGNPVAAAAGLATLETYKDEGLLTRGAELAPYWEEGLHSLKGLPHIIDIRNLGFLGAVELEPIAGKPTARAFSAYIKAFEQGLLIRTTGDTIAMSPPLIAERAHIDTIIETLGGILKSLE